MAVGGETIRTRREARAWVQEKYGYTRERAQDEYNLRRKAVEAYKESMSN